MPNPPAVDLGRVLPPRARQIVYAGFVLLLVVRFALDLAFTADPGWLLAVGRALDGLSPIVLGIALVNVPTGTVVSGGDATLVPDYQPRRAAPEVEWSDPEA